MSRVVAVLLLMLPEAVQGNTLVFNLWRQQVAVLVSKELIGTGKAALLHPILMRHLRPMVTIGRPHTDAHHLSSRTVLAHLRLGMVRLYLVPPIRSCTDKRVPTLERALRLVLLEAIR